MKRKNKKKRKEKSYSEQFADLEKLEWEMMFDTLTRVRKRKMGR